MSGSTALAAFDPFDPDHLSAPGAGWALLRREAPVYRFDRRGTVPIFIVSRRSDREAVNFVDDRRNKSTHLGFGVGVRRCLGGLAVRVFRTATRSAAQV